MGDTGNVTGEGYGEGGSRPSHEVTRTLQSHRELKACTSGVAVRYNRVVSAKFWTYLGAPHPSTLKMAKTPGSGGGSTSRQCFHSQGPISGLRGIKMSSRQPPRLLRELPPHKHNPPATNPPKTRLPGRERNKASVFLTTTFASHPAKMIGVMKNRPVS